MLTKKGKYGLKAMMHLAQYPLGQFVPVREIAETQNIPRKFLNTILCELRFAGFLCSRKGIGGGYSLASSADEISVGDVLGAINGQSGRFACANETRNRRCDDCSDGTSCVVKLILHKTHRELSKVFDGCTLAQMRTHA